GTVGVPLPGVSVAIAPDGEILAKGVPIFREYWNNDEATAKEFHDGWFGTGDLGSLDDDGYLTISGRKKEIMVTSSGKNIAPRSAPSACRCRESRWPSHPTGRSWPRACRSSGSTGTTTRPRPRSSTTVGSAPATSAPSTTMGI